MVDATEIYLVYIVYVGGLCCSELLKGPAN